GSGERLLSASAGGGADSTEPAVPLCLSISVVHSKHVRVVRARRRARLRSDDAAEARRDLSALVRAATRLLQSRRRPDPAVSVLSQCPVLSGARGLRSAPGLPRDRSRTRRKAFAKRTRPSSGVRAQTSVLFRRTARDRDHADHRRLLGFRCRDDELLPFTL